MEPEVKELLKEAKDQAAAKNYEQLLITAKEIVRLDRKNYTGYVFYGLGAAHQSQRDVSEKAYRKAIELNPTQATAHQGLVELFSMHGDQAKLSDALTELLAVLKPDHPKYLEYLVKRATSLQQQPTKTLLAAEAWRAVRSHAAATDEHRLLALRHLYDILLATEKAELQAETAKRFEVRSKKVPVAEHEQLRQTIDREVRTALYSRDEAEKMLEHLMRMSSTSDYHVKAVQRIQARMSIAPTIAIRDDLRSSLRNICLSAVSLQPSFFIIETLLSHFEIEHLSDKAAPLPSIPPSAARFFKLLMHSHPDRPLSNIGFSFLFLQQGKLEDAIALLDASLRKAPSSLLGWIALGYAQLDAALYQAAIETVSKINQELVKRQSTDSPSLPAARMAADLILARANHRGLGKKDEARGIYSTILQQQPLHTEALRGLAQLTAEANELAASLDLYSKLVAARPADVEAIAESGHVLLRLNRLPEAIERLQQAIALKNSFAMAHHWLGVAFWRSDGAQREKSKTEFLLSAQLKPEFAPNFTFLGHYYREIDKDEARARRCYQKAVTLDAQEDEAGIALADMYLASGQATLAEALYRELTTRSNRVLWAWLRLAVVQERDAQHEDAAASFQAALRLDPTNAVCWRGLAEAYRKQGKFMASLKAFSRLLEIDPKSAYGRYQVAAIELLLGLRVKSLAAFNTLLKELPDYVPALKGAGEAQLAIAKEQLAQGFTARAMDSIEKAVATLVKCTQRQGDLRSVWKAYGDAELLRAHLTRLHSNKVVVDILQSAIKAYETALKLGSRSPALLQDVAVARYQLAVELGQRGAKADEARKMLAAAEEELKEAVKNEPTNAHLWRALGVVAAQPALQQHAFIAAIEANDKSGGAWADLGHFYLLQGADDLAARAYAEAQSIEPHAPGGWLGQALVEELTANNTNINDAALLKRAKSAYDQALQALPTPLACLGAAHTSYACGDYDAAASAVQRYLQIAGANAHALNLLGLVLEAQELYPSAVAAFTEAIRHLSSSLSTSSPPPSSHHPYTTLVRQGATTSSPQVLHANLGRVLYFARKPQEAVTALSKADQTCRTNLLFLAAAQAMSGATNEAIKTAEKAFTTPASSAEETKALHALVVRLWCSQKNNDKSIAAAKRAAEETNDASLWQLFFAVASHAADAKNIRIASSNLPNTPSSGVLQSIQAQLEGNARASRSALLSALHRHPADESLWRRLAVQSLDFGATPTAALAALTSTIVPRSTSAEDSRLQSMLLLAQGKSSRLNSIALLRAACAAAQRSLRISPLDSDAIYLLAASSFSLARRTRLLYHWQRSENAIRLALSVLPQERLAKCQSALLAAQSDCLLFIGKLKEAREIAQQLAGGEKHGFSFAASQVQLARCKAAERDLNAAIALYKTALKDSPSYEWWTELAIVYEYNSQLAAAELCHRQAISICDSTRSSRRMNAFLRLARNLILRKQWSDANATLAEAAKINELHPTLLLLQGIVLAKLDAAADAEWCFQAVVAIEPALPLASLLLSEIHLAGGNVAAAASDAFYERDNSPDSDALFVQLAKIDLANKSIGTATTNLLRAIHMNPARSDYWAELHKLKQKPAAKK